MTDEIKNKPRLWIVCEVYYPEKISTGYYLTSIAEGLADDFTPAQFADLIAYLESLRPEKNLTPGEKVAGVWRLPSSFTGGVIATVNACTLRYCRIKPA